MKSCEIDRHILRSLERLDERYKEREEALDAYVSELEDRLAGALGLLSTQIERQSEVSNELSRQLQELHRQLSSSR